MAFDYDEENPIDESYIADFPGNERDHRTDVLGSVSVDHWAEAGPATPSQDGFHKQVSMPPSALDPSSVGNAGFVYTKDVAGITELFYEDDTPKVIQLTDDGSASPDKLPLAGGTLTGDLIMSSADVLMQGTSLMKLLNAKYLQGRDQTDANWRNLLGIDASDYAELGDANLAGGTRLHGPDADNFLVKYGANEKKLWHEGHFNTPLFTTMYESTPAAITAPDSGYVTHGIGSRPNLWMALLECILTDRGYAAGDHVPLMHGQHGVSPERWITVYQTDTRFGWEVQNSAPHIMQKGGNGSQGVLTMSKWKILFRAWY